MKKLGTRMGKEIKKSWIKAYMDNNFYQRSVKGIFREEYKRFAAYGGFARVIANNLQNPVFLNELLSSPTDQQRNVI